jgi:hypothetical protein
MNPWKLTSLVLATLLALVFAVHADRAARAEPQNHMRSALSFLGSARAELEKATADKGGHRAKAMDLTAAAITEVQDGIKFDNQH